MDKMLLLKQFFMPCSLFLLIYILSGCGEQDISPRAIKPEVDTCVVCNMSIAHEEYAAQLVLSNEDKLIFDDVGCLVQYIIDLQESEIGATYVKEYETNEWINSNKSYYVYHKDFWTPMSYGVLAFSNKEKAESFIEQEGKGELLTPEDLRNHNWGVHKK